MKKILLTISIILGIFAQSCESDPQHPEHPVSRRDIRYEGENLTVFLNGEELDFVKYAFLQSVVVDYGFTSDSPLDFGNPTYKSKIFINGFPTKKEKIWIYDIDSNFFNCHGDFEHKGVKYHLEGEFTGEPIDPDEFMTCTFYFTTIE